MSDLTPPCEFPVPNIDAITAAFGAPHDAYLSQDQLGDWYGFSSKNSGTPFHKAALGLFHRGGRLADYGLSFKSGIDATKAMRALQGLLCSFAPKHEIKIGTCAVALANWCDYTAEAQQ